MVFATEMRFRVTIVPFVLRNYLVFLQDSMPDFTFTTCTEYLQLEELSNLLYPVLLKSLLLLSFQMIVSGTSSQMPPCGWQSNQPGGFYWTRLPWTVSRTASKQSASQWWNLAFNGYYNCAYVLSEIRHSVCPRPGYQQEKEPARTTNSTGHKQPTKASTKLRDIGLKKKLFRFNKHTDHVTDMPHKWIIKHNLSIFKQDKKNNNC